MHNKIHNSYEGVEEDDNNEGVSEHSYDSQLTIMGTSAYETGDNGVVLTWGSLETNTNKTIKSKLTQPQQNINWSTQAAQIYFANLITGS